MSATSEDVPAVEAPAAEPAATPLGQLNEVAREIRAGESRTKTLRSLLSIFGQARRGSVVNLRVANTLAGAGLRTEPDFREVGLDHRLRFVLADTPEPSGDSAESTSDTTADDIEVVPNEVPKRRDATLYRVVRFIADDKRDDGLVSVSPDATIKKAITLMLCHDFSQLPVMGNSKHALGLFSWKSYGQAVALGHVPSTVGDCLEEPQTVNESDPVETLIERIQKHDAVLVRGADKQYVTLFTAADLADLYRDLSQDFIVLGQIESDLRALLDRAHFTTEEIAAARPPGDTTPVEIVDDLSFGSYVALVATNGHWERLDLRVEREWFVAELDAIRELRNAVMHFDPDGLEPKSKERLGRFANLLAILRQRSPLSAEVVEG